MMLSNRLGLIAGIAKRLAGTSVPLVIPPQGSGKFLAAEYGPGRGATMATQKESKKIYILFYTTYGHIYKMAKKVKEGVDTVSGAEGILYQVPEILSDSVLEKMHAPPKPDVPVLDPAELPNADGILCGFPTRYGGMCSQMKAFWDATGSLWVKGALVGKPIGMFVSTGTQGGGQETTPFTALTNFVHHGMIFVPPGYSMGSEMYDMSVIRGGSAWGAGTFAGADGSRQPSELELAFAKHQGKYTAEVVLKLTSK